MIELTQEELEALREIQQPALKISDREREILAFIERYFYEYGYAPTVREICKGVGLSSTSSGDYYMVRLFDKGLLETEHPGCPRAYRIKGAIWS